MSPSGPWAGRPARRGQSTPKRPTWTLFDYGVGNLHSLKKAVEATGRTVTVTSNPSNLGAAEAILLPGVGAFGAVMSALAPAKEALLAHHAAGRPILGVCIGMQVLYQGSQETPDVQGLGIIPGQVERIPRSAGKVPHMGWNQARPEDESDPINRTVLITSPDVYYVHSYAAPVTPETIATTDYGMRFAAAVRTGHTVGLQFHPEKSSHVGAAILSATLDSLEQAWGRP